MKDYGISVLEKYRMEVSSTRRIRGAVLCDTDKGLFLLKEVQTVPKRLPVLIELYRMLEENGFDMVDSPVANLDGEYVTQAEDGTKYMVKRWYQGHECDVWRETELTEGAKYLAKLHTIMRMPGEMAGNPYPLEEEFQRHNRELKKVQEFICRRSTKGAFETEFLKGFVLMYEWAKGAACHLEESGYRMIWEDALEKETWVHGDYNYHNLLFCKEGIAVTGFERAHRDIQLDDFYYFLRKAMEKHRYDERLGYKMLRAYDQEIGLGRKEREYLAIRLAYPEKFWKIVNGYYHSNKAWIPEKNVEKLRAAILQNEEKKRFLANIFTFHL
ncbi:MAG: phosphotransferase [Bariatricus sp.]|nr:phosphotransferase [Bariatricus sp.]